MRTRLYDAQLCLRRRPWKCSVRCSPACKRQSAALVAEMVVAEADAARRAAEADAKRRAEEEAERKDKLLLRLVTSGGLILSTEVNSPIIWP